MACAPFLAASAAWAADAPGCLSPGEIQEAVSERRVVAPAAAMVSAREAVPGGDVLRAALCRNRDAMVYLLTVLGKNGRLVRVTIDAGSGKVATLR